MPQPKIGTIHKMPSGKWLARYSAPNGKRYGKSFLTKGDGTKWLQIVYADISSGRWVSPGASATAMRFEDYSSAWLRSRKVKGQPIAERTREGYQDLLDRVILPEFGRRPLHEIDRVQVERWYDGFEKRLAALAEVSDRKRKRANADTYRARAYSLLRTIMKSAHEDGHIIENPVRIRGAGSVDRQHEVIPATLEELVTLTNAMPERYRLLVQLAAFCALRFGELAELRRGDVDTKEGLIRVARGVVLVGGKFVVKTPKTKAGIRRVAIPPHLMPMVRDHLLRFTAPGGDGLLFPSKNDSERHMRQSALARVYYPARTAAGRPDLRFHDLRHTGAVLAAQTGATLAELMARLGHSTPSAAMRYQHAAQDRDAVIASRLSEMVATASATGA